MSKQAEQKVNRLEGEMVKIVKGPEVDLQIATRLKGGNVKGLKVEKAIG